ncbi:hypothetical protein IQ07DRAFT_569731 [Pyrenochaeta sp. DS3sAY3a]|nr:hypothetical protein IQ07DRAFT_569731 [Pyrenochaeta sp. DS3sAY3a]
MSAINCGGCGQPSTNKCARCKIQHYCGRVCQTNHWAKHKSECKYLYIEHALQRVAHILQDTFLKFLENTWNHPLDKVVTTPNETFLYLGTKTEETLIEFPHGLMDDEETKMAVLTAGPSVNPTALFKDLLEGLLKDLDVKVEELTVVLGTFPRRTRLVLPNGATSPGVSNPKHDLISLSSNKTGRQWVFDLCGSQVGLYKPFWKFEDYNRRYVHSIHHRRPLGLNRWMLSEHAKLKGYEGVNLALNFEASISMYEEAKLWETQHVPLTQLPTLPKDQFGETKASLLQALNLRVQNFFRSSNYNERLRSALAYQLVYPEQFKMEREQCAARCCAKVTQSLLESSH